MPQVQNSNIQFTQDEENLMCYNNEEHFKECNKEMNNTLKEKLYCKLKYLIIMLLAIKSREICNFLVGRFGKLIFFSIFKSF